VAGMWGRLNAVLSGRGETPRLLRGSWTQASGGNHASTLRGLDCFCHPLGRAGDLGVTIRGHGGGRADRLEGKSTLSSRGEEGVGEGELRFSFCRNGARSQLFSGNVRLDREMGGRSGFLRH